MERTRQANIKAHVFIKTSYGNKHDRNCIDRVIAVKALFFFPQVLRRE